MALMEPVLQVALDFLELSRALKAAREAWKGGATWIEAGTPLIKSEGLEAIRAETDGLLSCQRSSRAGLRL